MIYIKSGKKIYQNSIGENNLNSIQINNTPIDDGYYMPPEWSEHYGTIITFPTRIGTWGKKVEYAQAKFAEIALHIAKYEKVFIVVGKNNYNKAYNLMKDNVQYLFHDTDDSWVRDNGPTFVTNGINIRGINWRFNAWGGEFDGLYTDWKLDDELAIKICNDLNIEYYDFGDFVLEGGSIHTNGKGTLVVTESCLLSKGRNPKLSKQQIENKLKSALGVKKVLWLPNGIFKDETNGHVDNMCAFVKENEVVLAWTDNESDPQYKLSKENYEYLNSEVDGNNNKIKIHKLPIPDIPICIDESDIELYQFDDTSNTINQTHNIGTRYPASYVNFYIANNIVLVPQFGGENELSDKRAIEIISKLFVDREIIGIDARVILMGGGNIHCITQQIPKFQIK